jgi:hypothetical protein
LIIAPLIYGARNLSDWNLSERNPSEWNLSEGIFQKILLDPTGIIEAALDQVAPIKPYRPKKAVFSWWNSDLEEICKKSRRAHNFVSRQPHLHNRWEAYRPARKELKNSSLKAQKDSWRKFTSEQVSPKEAARLNKILQR